MLTIIIVIVVLVVAVGLFVVANQPLGASGAYVQTIKVARRDTDAVSWRVWYFGGIFVGGALASVLGPGIVMGYGARMAGGCTSGHGICGTAQRSAASWATTATFMATAIVVTFVIRSITSL